MVDRILTEGGDSLITEGGDSLITEASVAAAAPGGAGGDARNARKKPRAVIVHFADEEIPTETPPTEVVAPTTPYPKRKAKPKAKPAPIEDDEEEEAIIMLLAA